MISYTVTLTDYAKPKKVTYALTFYLFICVYSFFPRFFFIDFVYKIAFLSVRKKKKKKKKETPTKILLFRISLNIQNKFILWNGFEIFKQNSVYPD